MFIIEARDVSACAPSVCGQSSKASPFVILVHVFFSFLLGQGKDNEAEPLHERALQLREALLGSRHADVATSLEFLTRMALKQGACVDKKIRALLLCRRQEKLCSLSTTRGESVHADLCTYPFRRALEFIPILECHALLNLPLPLRFSTGKTYKEMEGLVTRLVDAREACLTRSNAPPAIEVRHTWRKICNGH